MSRTGNGPVNRRGRASAGKVIAGNFATSVEPPLVIPDGKVRCPACRNVASLTPRGNLYRHKDLFGADCWNRTPDLPRVGPSDPPDVVLPPPGKPPGRRIIVSETEPPPVVPVEGNARKPNGQCFECGKAIPPMRRLCGRCMSGRRR